MRWKLAKVIDELAKMVGALNEEIVCYLSLTFNEKTVVISRSAHVRDARVQLTETISSLRSMQTMFIVMA